jgi:hypothetical protein
MIDKKLAIARLIKAGINVKDGKISKREILAAYKALAEELTYDTLRESANEVGADGMGALDLYMERYHPNASGPEELLNALEGFKSDCEDYILPAIERLIAHLGGEADSCMAKANVEDDLSTIRHLDSYFKDCEGSGQGINSKETVQMKQAMERVLKERMGYALDLNDELVSENGKNAIQRAMDVVYPGMREMFSTKASKATAGSSIDVYKDDITKITFEMGDRGGNPAALMHIIANDGYSDFEFAVCYVDDSNKDQIEAILKKHAGPVGAALKSLFDETEQVVNGKATSAAPMDQQAAMKEIAKREYTVQLVEDFDVLHMDVDMLTDKIKRDLKNLTGKKYKLMRDYDAGYLNLKLKEDATATARSKEEVQKELADVKKKLDKIVKDAHEKGGDKEMDKEYKKLSKLHKKLMEEKWD